MRRKARKGGGRQVEVTVESLGGRGDGVATLEGQPLFVPFALPGERAQVRLAGRSQAGIRGELLALLDESPDRIAATCPHFGACGGCTVQHLAEPAYRRWTRDLVVQALGRRGLTDPPVAEPLFVGAATRRRATLAARRRGRRVAVGFHPRASHAIEDIATCQVLAPAIVDVLPALRVALTAVLAEGESADVTVLASETGLDVLVAAPGPPPGLAAREALAALAQDADLARLSSTEARAGGGASDSASEPEPVAIRRAPLLTFGGVAVEPPPGGFVQPTAAGESALLSVARAALARAHGPVADLFAGLGPFTFALADQHRVHAVEGDAPAIAALWRAARRHDRVGRVTAEVRDLARAPLTPRELADFAGVVLDPPRVGARAQAEALAESPVETVVALSCNPNTFARDARTLVDGGYTLESVQPVDQFPWTGHVELAAVFRRPA